MTNRFLEPLLEYERERMPRQDFYVSSLEEVVAFLSMAADFGVGRVFSLTNTSSGKTLHFTRNVNQLQWMNRSRAIKVDWLYSLGLGKGEGYEAIGRDSYHRVKAFADDTWSELE